VVWCMLAGVLWRSDGDVCGHAGFPLCDFFLNPAFYDVSFDEEIREY
jgi:hypothetical protein